MDVHVQSLLFGETAVVDPRIEPVGRPPIGGKDQSARDCSASGARVVVKTWPERQSVVLQLLAGGPKTRQELADLTPYGINGVCSVVVALLTKKVIEKTGDKDVHVDGNGDVTRRERLRIKR